jgi:hypothetical protein
LRDCEAEDTSAASAWTYEPGIFAGAVCIYAQAIMARKHVSEHDAGLGRRVARYPQQSVHDVALPERCEAVLAMTELMDDDLEILSMVPIGKYALPLTMCAGTFHSIVGAVSPPGKFRHLTACRACHASQSSLQVVTSACRHNPCQVQANADAEVIIAHAGGGKRGTGTWCSIPFSCLPQIPPAMRLGAQSCNATRGGLSVWHLAEPTRLATVRDGKITDCTTQQGAATV